MGEEHPDLFALAARGLVSVRFGDLPGEVARAFVDRAQHLAAEFFDLAGDSVNALVQVTSIFVKIEDQPGHARRYLVLSVLQYREKRVAKGARASPDGNALLNQEGSDLVDRRRPAGDQSRPDAVTRLQFLDEAQVRSQRRLGDGLGIVVIVLLSLHERFDVDRRDDPRLVPSVRNVLLTKCALRQASMPTMHGGTFSNGAAKPSA